MIPGWTSPLGLLLLLQAFAAVPSLAQTPDGPVFLVNSTSKGDQFGPAVAMDAGGRAVVLWWHVGPPPRVLGQRFDPQGTPVFGQFVCSDPLPGDFSYGVLLQGTAGFLSLWASGSGDYARHHLPTGSPAGDPVLVNRTPCADPACADYLIGFSEGSGGEFAGVWERVTPEEHLVFARWFDRDARPLTGEIPLRDDLASGAINVAAGLDRTVALERFDFNPSGPHLEDLNVQVYSVTGEKLSAEFLVPSIPAWNHKAALGWNRLTRTFVVAWIWEEPSRAKIFAQRLLPDGQALDQHPLLLFEGEGTPSWPPRIACNVQGYCAVAWDTYTGMRIRILRPDGSLGPAAVAFSALFALPETLAYGGNGALMVIGEVGTPEVRCTDIDCTDYDIGARRLIASPADEVCQRVGNEVQCDSGRTGSMPELLLAEFGLSRRDQLLFGDVNGDGRADPCRVFDGIWRCDADHEGKAERKLSFDGAAAGTPLLGDLDGDGIAEPCTWRKGVLRCNTARNGGPPELTLSYGSRGDSPFLGDLNGDGRDDLCLWSRGLLRCDVGHNGGQNELRITFGQAGDQFLLGDFDGNGTDDPGVARAGKLLCDTAHDGGEAEGSLVLGTPGAPVLMGNLDGV